MHVLLYKKSFRIIRSKVARNFKYRYYHLKSKLSSFQTSYLKMFVLVISSGELEQMNKGPFLTFTTIAKGSIDLYVILRKHFLLKEEIELK